MTRKYQKKKIPKSVEKELIRLSTALPKMEKIGVVKDYHYLKLSYIYLRAYKASSAKARDLKVQKEFEVYCNSIYNLYKSYAHQEQKGGFEPFATLMSLEYPDKCVVCKKEELKKVNQFKGDDRLICNSCGAFYAKNSEVIEVFYEQLDLSIEEVEEVEKEEIDYSVTFIDNKDLKVSLSGVDLDSFEDTLDGLCNEIDLFTREHGDTMKYYNMLPDFIKLEVISWGIDTPIGDSIYMFFKDNESILIFGTTQLDSISSTLTHITGLEVSLFQGFRMFELAPIDLKNSFIEDGGAIWMDELTEWFKSNKIDCVNYLGDKNWSCAY